MTITVVQKLSKKCQANLSTDLYKTLVFNSMQIQKDFFLRYFDSEEYKNVADNFSIYFIVFCNSTSTIWKSEENTLFLGDRNCSIKNAWGKIIVIHLIVSLEHFTSFTSESDDRTENAFFHRNSPNVRQQKTWRFILQKGKRFTWACSFSRISQNGNKLFFFLEKKARNFQFWKICITP